MGFWWLASRELGQRGNKDRARRSDGVTAQAEPHGGLQRGPEYCSSVALHTESELECTSDVLDGVWTGEGLVTCPEVKSMVKSPPCWLLMSDH